MSDRHAEGIEKAAEALDAEVYGGADSSMALARAAVTAYMEHTHPEVATSEELDALPVGVIVLLRDGDIWRRFADGWWCESGPGIKEPIWYTQDFPARVIHWGGAS